MLRVCNYLMYFIKHKNALRKHLINTFTLNVPISFHVVGRIFYYNHSCFVFIKRDKTVYFDIQIYYLLKLS